MCLSSAGAGGLIFSVGGKLYQTCVICRAAAKQNNIASISCGSGIIENKLCCVAVLLQTKY